MMLLLLAVHLVGGVLAIAFGARWGRQALWAAVVWEASKYAFVWNLGRMQLATFYGPLAFAVSLVLWAYVSSVVLVFGAAMAPGTPGRGR